MAGASYGDKAMLDWVLGGATPTRPGSRFLTYATQSPNVTSAFDGPFTPRRTVSMAAANSPSGSSTNLAAISCTASAIATVVGWNLYDAPTGGNRLCWGTMSVAIGCASGDTMGIATGNLKITLS